MDVKLAARALAVGRIAVGLGLFLSPRRLTRGWLGREADGRAVPAVVRGIGARDVAIGVGLLLALREGEPVRDAERWLEAGIVGDLGDAAGTALVGTPDAGRWSTIAIAGGAALAGIALRSRLR
jgi:hypothetical protein